MAKRKGWMGIKRRELAKDNNVVSGTVALPSANNSLNLSQTQVVQKIASREVDLSLTFSQTQAAQKIASREVDLSLTFSQTQAAQKIGNRSLTSTETMVQTVSYTYVPKPFTGQLGTATSKLSTLELGVT